MLPLEAIAVLGFIYLFFTYGMVKAQLVRRRAQKASEIRSVRAKSAPEPVRSSG